MKFLKRVAFLIQYKYAMTIVKRTGTIFTYPLLVRMSFKKEEMFERYLEGKSVWDQVVSMLDIIETSMRRHLTRECSPELSRRLNRYKASKQRRQDVEDQVKYAFGETIDEILAKVL